MQIFKICNFVVCCPRIIRNSFVKIKLNVTEKKYNLTKRRQTTTDDRRRRLAKSTRLGERDRAFSSHHCYQHILVSIIHTTVSIIIIIIIIIIPAMRCTLLSAAAWENASVDCPGISSANSQHRLMSHVGMLQYSWIPSTTNQCLSLSNYGN